jgi:hypothetical protein
MEIILVLNLGILIGCVISALVSVWFARKNNVRELQNDLEEVAVVVEKIHRESKRQQMQRVRAAAGVADFAVPPGVEPHPAPTPVTAKQALRNRVFGGH